MTDSVENKGKPSQSYEAGCHCGFISLTVTLSPPFPEKRVVHCNCSICRRAGYLLVYPPYQDVTWHEGSEDRVSRYRFNTKTRDHMFCPRCGASIGIDFFENEPKNYGISVRQFDDVDLDSLAYDKFDGKHVLKPSGDFWGKKKAKEDAETGKEVEEDA